MLNQLRENMEIVRLAKKRGLRVNHVRVWADVAKLAGGIVVIGLKLFGHWNPFREGWRIIRNGRRQKVTKP